MSIKVDYRGIPYSTLQLTLVTTGFFFFLAVGAAEAADVKASMNPALSITTPDGTQGSINDHIQHVTREEDKQIYTTQLTFCCRFFSSFDGAQAVLDCFDILLVLSLLFWGLRCFAGSF